MEEKVIISSERKRILVPCFIVAVIIHVMIIVFTIADVSSKKKINPNGDTTPLLIESIGLSAILLYGLVALIYFIFSKCELTVTNKRVYGRAVFGKRVDLPLDAISAVGTSMMKGISVGTSSGTIKFKFINNSAEIHSAISDLLLDRQGKEKPVVTTTIKQEIPQSNADELKKYKELLDSGVITQEEFDAKKKQLLGL